MIFKQDNVQEAGKGYKNYPRTMAEYNTVGIFVMRKQYEIKPDSRNYIYDH